MGHWLASAFQYAKYEKKSEVSLQRKWKQAFGRLRGSVASQPGATFFTLLVVSCESRERWMWMDVCRRWQADEWSRALANVWRRERQVRGGWHWLSQWHFLNCVGLFRTLSIITDSHRTGHGSQLCCAVKTRTRFDCLKTGASLPLNFSLTVISLVRSPPLSSSAF